MSECLFCKILLGEIPSTKVFENENVYAFKDINPCAKTHVLFIHKKHTRDVSELIEKDLNQVSDIFQGIGEWTKAEGLDQKGYRVVNNCGENAGQTVFHTHFHILSDSKLGGFGN